MKTLRYFLKSISLNIFDETHFFLFKGLKFLIQKTWAYLLVFISSSYNQFLLLYLPDEYTVLCIYLSVDLPCLGRSYMIFGVWQLLNFIEVTRTSPIVCCTYFLYYEGMLALFKYHIYS